MTGRRPWLALVAATLVAACASPQPSVVRTGSQVYAPTASVEMLDRPPDRPYTEIGVIDAPGEPDALRAQVIAQVLEKARQLGADAVILIDQSHRAPASQRLNPTTGYYETVGGQVIPSFKGIAIKYR